MYLSKPGILMILSDLRKIFPPVSIINKRILSIKILSATEECYNVQPNVHIVHKLFGYCQTTVMEFSAETIAFSCWPLLQKASS